MTTAYPPSSETLGIIFRYGQDNYSSSELFFEKLYVGIIIGESPAFNESEDIIDRT